MADESFTEKVGSQLSQIAKACGIYSSDNTNAVAVPCDVNTPPPSDDEEEEEEEAEREEEEATGDLSDFEPQTPRSEPGTPRNIAFRLSGTKSFQHKKFTREARKRFPHLRISTVDRTRIDPKTLAPVRDVYAYVQSPRRRTTELRRIILTDAPVPTINRCVLWTRTAMAVTILCFCISVIVTIIDTPSATHVHVL